jgi:hypothetical protein
MSLARAGVSIAGRVIVVGTRKLLSAIAIIAMGVGLTLAWSAPSAASGGARQPFPSEPLTASATIEPPDESGLTFTAFRSSGLPIVPGESFWLSVHASVPAPPPTFAELVGGQEIVIGEATWQDAGTVNGVPQRIANWLIEEPAEGTHAYLAIFPATETFDGLRLTLDVAVERVTMTIAVASDVNPVQTNHEVVLYPVMEGGGTGSALTGEFEWRNPDSGTLLATRPADDYFLRFSSLPPGAHHFTVHYTGDPHRAAVTSPSFTLTVTDDTVEVSGVGLQFTRFYPVSDGYRDTVAIRGTRLESASVAIKVTGPTGGTVRTASLPAGSGAYSYAWNGRTTAGALLPAGRYTVRQTLSDGQGATNVVTSSVVLEHAKLVTKTAYVSRKGSAISVQGRSGDGTVTVSTSGGYTKLTASSGWSSVGWEFLIPGAVIYNSVSVEINARAGFSVPPSQLGIQNFNACPRGPEWDTSCFERWTNVGVAGGSQRWYATSGSSSGVYRAGQYVRGLIVVDFGTVHVYEARAKVVYQVLDGALSVGRVVVAR